MDLQSNWPRRIALLTGISSFLLGLAVLIGWSVHSVALIQIVPSLAPMQRMTALSFALCGLALCLITMGRRTAAAACAALPLFIAVAVTSEYIFDADLHIDQLLGPGYITVRAPYPGRMSQLTTFCFLLIASALVCAAFRVVARHASLLFGLIGSVIVTLGLVSMLSHLIAQKEAYVWGHILQVSLHTRAGLMLLGMGLLAVAWQENPQSQRFPSWLPWSAGLALAVCVLGLWQAFVMHQGRTVAALSLTLLIGGLIIATFLALTVYLAQTAFNRSLELQIYRMAFENSIDGILLTGVDGSVQAANPAACQILGRTEQEICQEKRKGVVDESDRRFQQLLEQRSRTGVAHGEISARRKDGTFFPVEVSSVTFKDPLGNVRSCTSLRDISRRKRAESELRIQTERLSLATRAASIGVWDLDLRTRMTIWDDTHFEMFGIPKQIPMPYEAWARTVHPDDLPAAEASLQRVINLKTQDYVEFRIIRPDGSLRYISSAQGIVLDEQGKAIRIVGIAMDISERKRLQEQLAISARLSAVGMMAGGVAHEVNNPLAIIRASASDLLDIIHAEGQVSLEEVTRNARRIQQTADRIATIVKSLRRIAREGSQDDFLPVPVSKIVEETLEICQERFGAHSVTLRLPRIDPRLKVSCREVQIAQVLLNLLTNAFDAVAGQPGEKWVQLEVKRTGESIIFSVVDSGPGIPPEIRSRIMEPFFTTKEVGKGVGLGLSVSRTMAEEHGGKLELVESLGHTCFSLTLPVAGSVGLHAA